MTPAVLAAVLLAVLVGWPGLIALAVVVVARWGAHLDRRSTAAAVIAEAEQILAAASPR